ncbi:RagB/SusD family nutrient uptake outer membrane protein [Chitinophaga sp. CB10]|uniref:RagB/SusD family nutrient uptake outer membrane protein n=1 Tax=Chitinophaga sp. CB10 TaxID=1891659 RepID=UPI000AC23664|nr:RagB/SusD family nutrient uptake outer membrane protein [Chitinophaga sp. CB10]
MKRKSLSIIRTAVLASSVAMLATGCTKNLLDQQPTTEVGSSFFWKTEDDATYALMGAYNATRSVFDRDYYFDGQGEYTRTRGTSTSSGDPYNPSSSAGYQSANYGDKFDNYFKALYGSVNRANYVIENVKSMIDRKVGNREKLEVIIGEARLLRGMTYFRLISMWGDVPYFDKVATSNADVQTLSRMPIAQIKDSIMNDFTYAFEKLPAKPSAVGRAAKPAALAFRGKLQLFWGSWNKNGWPELTTFKPDATAASEAFKAAAADFGHVINDYGLTLFRGGEPGNIDTLGGAEILPNYFYLFMPAANGDAEMIMAFTHGGTSTGQGESLMRDFAGRTMQRSQCWVSPRYELADRYQLITTGEEAPKLKPMAPGAAGARTAPNSALNPQSYANRDYRMKSTIMWDYEKALGMQALKSTGFAPFIYKSWNLAIRLGGVDYITYDTDGCNSGYVYRKFVRNYAGQDRTDGDYNYPVMRLADVFLMYAEASNEAYGPQADAVALVNKVRHRGNLPPLKADRYASKDAFFAAIEQERIVELVAEGQRAFDLRRWRKLEKLYGGLGGVGVGQQDTQGAVRQSPVVFQNATERDYARAYIFKIPQSERDRNPNLTQNTPWL